MASSPKWTWDDHKRFVSAREQFPDGSPSSLENIAQLLHKPLEEVTHYYNDLVIKTDHFENMVDLDHNPDQESDSEDDDVRVKEARKRQRTDQEEHRLDDNVRVKEPSQRQRTDQEEHRLDDNVPVVEASQVPKNKGHWTEDEHRSFLEGLGKYGDGRWEMISRVSVRTRDAKQVANHADKYYKRQKLPSDKKRRRRSILDMTLESINCKGKPDFGKKDPPDDGGTSQGSCLGV